MSYTLHTAAAEVALLNAECEAGPLDKSAAWQWLEKMINSGPDIAIGQRVWKRLEAVVAGVPISDWAQFTVVGIHTASSSDSIYFTYDLSRDPPAPYHYGSGVDFPKAARSEITLERPTP